ncbi:MAG: DUF1080 domain-containing protein [Bacteroidota bacterium]
MNPTLHRRLAVVYAIIFLAASSCTPGTEPKAEAEPTMEFMSIFNGENLDGWTLDQIDADTVIQAFSIEEGDLILDTPGTEDYVWLTYDKELTDFGLKLKFIAYQDAVGNCGIQFRDQYENNVYPRHGFDLASNVPQSTGFIWDFQEHWLPFAMQGYKAENFEPHLPEGWTYKWSTDPEPWNDFEVRVIGSRVQTWLNGKPIIDWDGGDKILPSGHIAIEVHKGQVFRFRFKDIELADLSV